MNAGAMGRQPRAEPLDGIVVLELGGFITGPYAGLLLADLGADVIKVERPEGDPFRVFREGFYSPNFVGFNRNKRSMTLDLTTP
ncbi:MAG: CoA transferase, partial [Pigmentiphaga sp.]